MRYGKHLNPPVKKAKSTPQSQPIPGREKEMIQNTAGGYTFTTNMWQQLDRFLILGSEGGSYYIGEDKLTINNAGSTIACIKADGVRTVARAVEISEAGRAVKNDAAIFVLALAIKHGNDLTRQAAYGSISRVCRTGTHLFTLTQALSDIGKGWGRGLKRAVGNWYLEKGADSLAFQVAKYQQRNGWSNADLLRLSHPKSEDSAINSIFKWIVDGVVSQALPRLLIGFEKAKGAKTVNEVVNLITEYNLPRECVPTQFLNEAAVWEALLPKMPLTALIRNLGNMTKSGVLTAGSAATKLVVQKLSDAEYIRKSRVHPIAILIAMKTYTSGTGRLGKGTWTAVPKIIAALDGAFYKAFANVEPTGKNFYIGIDVSGSMSWTGSTNGNLMASECAAAVAMTIMRSEPSYYTYGFCSSMVDLGLHDAMSLNEVLKKTSGLTFGRTNCAQPMIHALKMKMDVDTFIVITDNETWAGSVQPVQALQQYREKMNKPNAKLIVLATSSNKFTIADPKDLGMLDVAGFDASVPQIISEFTRLDV
jgi:60 kDa SS-A/Ro ribonucleoprotein